MRHRTIPVTTFTLGLYLAGVVPIAAADNPSPGAKRSPVTAPQPGKWVSLFDGKSLKGWKKTKFGGEGEVTVKDGRLILGYGSDLTGVHTKRKLPKSNYEVRLEARRADGSDFFCGFTFPVQKSHCSLIVGGWGGGVCGLSCIDKRDASENSTATYRRFKNKKWYRIRVRVTEEKIEAWIDDKQIVDQKIKGREISVRAEVLPSRPFGFATWQTTGELRNIRLRPLTAPVAR